MISALANDADMHNSLTYRAPKLPQTNLGLLHLHDAGLAVSDAVVDVVDVSAQRLQLLVQGGQAAIGVGPLCRHLFSLPGYSLSPLGQVLTLLD